MLSLAAESGRVHTLEYLLLQGADVNARDRENRTALEVATERGQADAAKILQDQAAKVALRRCRREIRVRTSSSAATTTAARKHERAGKIVDFELRTHRLPSRTKAAVCRL